MNTTDILGNNLASVSTLEVVYPLQPSNTIYSIYPKEPPDHVHRGHA